MKQGKSKLIDVDFDNMPTLFEIYKIILTSMDKENISMKLEELGFECEKKYLYF